MSLSVSTPANSSNHYTCPNTLLSMLNPNPQDNRYMYNLFNPIRYTTSNSLGFQYETTNSPTAVSEAPDYSNASPLAQQPDFQHPQQLQQLQSDPRPPAFNIYSKYPMGTPPAMPMVSASSDSLRDSLRDPVRDSYPYLSYQQPQPLPTQQPQTPQEQPRHQRQPSGQQHFKYALQPPLSAPAATGLVSSSSAMMVYPSSHSSSVSNPEHLPRFSYPGAQAPISSLQQQAPVYLSEPLGNGPGFGGPAANTNIVPKLVRTTSLPVNKVPGTVYSNPGGLDILKYPRVSLHIHGDLGSMTAGWSDKELAARRRLVKFQWSQVGTCLQVTFKPIPQDKYDPQDTVVSCLLWKLNPNLPTSSKNFFVTSVDVIQLLEHLVNLRFAVEEKNRIRRNLQALRPLTVARSKKDFSEFFQQIMKYQAPRPRNIEKDVKVFPWNALPSALDKVLAKYSCDYSAAYASPINQHPPLEPPQSDSQPVANLSLMPRPPRQQQQQQQQQQAPPPPPPMNNQRGFPVKMENPIMSYPPPPPLHRQGPQQLPDQHQQGPAMVNISRALQWSTTPL